MKFIKEAGLTEWLLFVCALLAVALLAALLVKMVRTDRQFSVLTTQISPLPLECPDLLPQEQVELREDEPWASFEVEPGYLLVTVWQLDAGELSLPTAGLKSTARVRLGEDVLYLIQGEEEIHLVSPGELE
jgi:hypothetical protein